MRKRPVPPRPGVLLRTESLPEGHAEPIAATLGIEPDSPILNGVAQDFTIYLGLSGDDDRTRSLDSRQLKRVRESARDLSAALDGCNDDTWAGLWLRVNRGEPGKREDWPHGIRLDDGSLLRLDVEGIQHEVERLERAATPAQGTPKMERERYLLSSLLLRYQTAKGERATRRVSKPGKWDGSTEYKEYGPFWEFLEACKKAYGLEHESWVEPLKDVLSLFYGEKSARE